MLSMLGLKLNHVSKRGPSTGSCYSIGYLSEIHLKLKSRSQALVRSEHPFQLSHLLKTLHRARQWYYANRWHEIYFPKNIQSAFSSANRFLLGHGCWWQRLVIHALPLGRTRWSLGNMWVILNKQFSSSGFEIKGSRGAKCSQIEPKCA